MPPKVTIITPTKNRLKLLCEAMVSVQAQTFAEWEHIIVDDGSDDDTAKEVRRRAQADSRVRYIVRNIESAGANVCRNIGVREAAADFVLFLDSDDLLMPHCLMRRLEIMERNADIDFAVFQTQVFIGVPGDTNLTFNQELSGDDLLRFLFFEPPWIITGPIWRKATLQRIGAFDEGLLSWQDIELHVRAILSSCRYLRFAEADHHVRWQNDPDKISILQRRSERHLNAVPELLQKFERMIVAGPGMNWVRQRALCGLYFMVAELWVAAGSLSSGLRVWRMIDVRVLGSKWLHLTGAVLLAVQNVGWPIEELGQRVKHKWKGWMRLRTNPELVAGREDISADGGRAASLGRP
jgi:glycosyltransferase involved in cell wall biosynthesis